MEPRETPAGAALDLGSIYAYPSDRGPVFWWSGSGHNTTFRTTEEVVEYFSERLYELEQAAVPEGARTT